MSKTEEQLIKELEKYGWGLAYFNGHGDDEPISDVNQDMVVGDIEKTVILAPSGAFWDKPRTYEEYFG